MPPWRLGNAGGGGSLPLSERRRFGFLGTGGADFRRVWRSWVGCEDVDVAETLRDWGDRGVSWLLRGEVEGAVVLVGQAGGSLRRGCGCLEVRLSVEWLADGLCRTGREREAGDAGLSTLTQSASWVGVNGLGG